MTALAGEVGVPLCFIDHCTAEDCIEPSLVERIYRDAKLLGLGGVSTAIMNELINHDI